ncbi:MAG: selenoneine synthase SenA [Burkholderiaceae bacterium]
MNGAKVRRANRDQLTRILRQTREHTWAMFEHIDDELARVPYLPIINPPLWEVGHVAWFQEYWILRQADLSRPCLHPDGDRLYDSARVAHRDRWSIPLPDLAASRAYVDAVQEASLERLQHARDDDDGLYFHRLSVAHEMMHIEAFAYTWQTLGYPRPAIQAEGPGEIACTGRGALGTGEVELGSRAGEGFVFDNEQWAHPVPVPAFEIDLAPVTNQRYLAFVDDGGYRNPSLWSDSGWRWLLASARSLPRDWRRDGQTMQVRLHQQWRPLPPQWPVAHVSAYEAEAFARWAGGHLPSEAQWLRAARELEGFEAGASVWEWTASWFDALPGFTPGAYREYSQPWLRDHRLVRGGSFVTPRDLVDRRFRNFYKPDRDDPYLGFRVCYEPA